MRRGMRSPEVIQSEAEVHPNARSQWTVWDLRSQWAMWGPRTEESVKNVRSVESVNSLRPQESVSNVRTKEWGVSEKCEICGVSEQCETSGVRSQWAMWGLRCQWAMWGLRSQWRMWELRSQWAMWELRSQWAMWELRRLNDSWIEGCGDNQEAEEAEGSRHGRWTRGILRRLGWSYRRLTWWRLRRSRRILRRTRFKKENGGGWGYQGEDCLGGGIRGWGEDAVAQTFR